MGCPGGQKYGQYQDHYKEKKHHREGVQVVTSLAWANCNLRQIPPRSRPPRCRRKTKFSYPLAVCRHWRGWCGGIELAFDCIQ